MTDESKEIQKGAVKVTAVGASLLFGPIAGLVVTAIYFVADKIAEGNDADFQEDYFHI